jgi:hypothetical protein
MSSVDCHWDTTFGRTCLYVYGRINRRKVGIILLIPSRYEMLHSIVHEINECETQRILKHINADDDVNITKKMVKKYPWLFKHPMKHLSVTHIISPYGKGNCAMDRKKYRLNW